MRNIMVQGTSSYAGKTFLAMALCRILSKRGYKVAPFKSQNTSLNSYVTEDGCEISRAQALQAMAAGIEPTVAMNPILVKPKGDHTSQVVVNGRPHMDIEAWSYYEEFALSQGVPIVKEAMEKLEDEYDFLIIEGAGSPAEINLYDRDISNMRVAEMADAAVILAADIDRGGVFASIYGTISLLPQKDQERIKGVVINKFRGDIEILKPGLEDIESRTKVPVLGVVPYIHDLQLPGEDSMSIADSPSKNGLDIAVIRLPRISNSTDFDPLVYDGANVRYVSRASDIGNPDALIVPGTKNTLSDMEWLREQGFSETLKSLSGKVPIIGICGGYQILGKEITDNGIEGAEEKTVEGLGLLDVSTEFMEYEKTTERVEGMALEMAGPFKDLKGKRVQGYEIHMGKTARGEGVSPVLDLGGKQDGAVRKDGMVMGAYLHGLFDSSEFRRAFLGVLRPGDSLEMDAQDIWLKSIDKAAEVVVENIDVEEILGWIK